MCLTLVTSLFVCIAGALERTGPASDAAYHAALVAAVHHFAEEGELVHLRAVLGRHPKLVDARKALAEGRKPNSTDYFTAFHFAADEGQEDVVAYLIEKGADVNADGGGMWTPLHRAANAGHLPVVRRLVEAGRRWTRRPARGWR